MSYNYEEVEKFSRLSESWWDEFGEMKMLHRFNPIRLNYIDKQIGGHFPEARKILDFGCGAGILSESLARKNYDVTGIDPSFANIKVAQKHSKNQKISVKYLQQDEFFSNPEKFDVICVFEVLEHVDNLKEFVSQIASLSHENTLVIFSTINRNLKSSICAKYIAEYVLKIVPRGTHAVKKFLKPSEVNNLMELVGFNCINIQGVSFQPLSSSFSYSKSLDINYFISFKPKG